MQTVCASWRYVAGASSHLQLQRLQIGALYMFSYVSKEFLEILKYYEDLLEEVDVDEEEERTLMVCVCVHV